jgi:gliding motility-associated lipoprotein GldH
MKRIVFYLALAIALLTGCARDKGYQIYHQFADKTWFRFNILKFEIPVKNSSDPVNVVFFARHDRDYPFDSLAFNMVMKAPSGEERIRECRIRMKDNSGNFLGTFHGDSCEMTFILKKDMIIGRDGVLTIELENLVPRMRTTGLLGVGIRLEKP